MALPVTEPSASTRRALDEFFSQSVLKHPDRPALVIHGKTWTYRELDWECSKIEQTLGVAGLAGTGCNIGVAYTKGMLSYAAAIAIMRTNNVYVPINPQMPADRILRIIEDARLQAVIVDTDSAPSEGVSEALLRSRAMKLLVSEEPAAEFETLVQAAPQHEVRRISATHTPRNDCAAGGPLEESSLAYILFTSGSTGVPKGVPITQESACRCIEKSHRLFNTDEHDRFTQFSALSFDVSILDLFLCWKSGAALHVPEPSDALVPMSFAVSNRITVWSSVPSLANFLLKLRLLKSNALSHLRLSLFCGEALPSQLAQAWLTAAPASRLINLYGPTECTIYATFYEYRSRSDTREAIVPIGEPLPGLRCLVVDQGRVVEEDDVPGELWLSGDQLTGGYWNNAAATEAAFVPLPANLAHAGLWYRTGDLVSWRQGMGLLFRGRLDRQVKLRGYRVELQEVESALKAIVGCTLVAIVPVRNSGGICEKLIAYCDKLDADESTIKDRCSRRIPRYMVPDRIIELESFPVSTSGKIDYLALAGRSTAPGAR